MKKAVFKGGLALAAAALVALIPGLASAGRLRALTAGDAVTCAVNHLGGLWCWGRNNAGQLGDGTTVEPHWPESILGFAPLAVTRDDNTCVLNSSGRVLCAGANNFGQLGDGTNIERHQFTLVGGNPSSGGNVFSFTAGNTACFSQFGVACWGDNQLGGVGDGTNTDRSSPVALAQNLHLDGMETSGANGHTCGVQIQTESFTTPGDLWCWGNNAHDVLGAGPGLGAQSSTPVRVAALGPNVSRDYGAIGVGVNHACAKKTDGTLWCWGLNDHGQLGDGNTTDSSTPVQVAALGASVSGVAVSPTGSFTCARTSAGAYCWGRNDRGQLGDGTTDERHLPTAVALSLIPDDIVAGNNHACVDKTNDVFWCWGANDHGQVGDGTVVDRPTPVSIVLAPQPVPHVPAGNVVTTALLSLFLLGIATAQLRRHRRQ